MFEFLKIIFSSRPKYFMNTKEFKEKVDKRVEDIPLYLGVQVLQDACDDLISWHKKTGENITEDDFWKVLEEHIKENHVERKHFYPERN